MKKVTLLAAAIIFLIGNNKSLHAQDVLRAESGAVITVQSGAVLYVNGGINLIDGSTLNNAGTITIARTGAGTANFTDNSVTPYAYGTGEFILTGSDVQTMRGSIFHDLKIDNAAGVSMLISQNVNNNLSLTNGSLSIGPNKLNLFGSVTGSGKLKGSPASSLIIGGVAGTLNFDQTDSASRSLKDFKFINGDATLGNAVQVYGAIESDNSTFHINNQSLVLKSVGNGSTATARVGNLTGSTIDGASNVTVERYIASPQRAWHLLSAKAVTGSQTIREAWQENGGVYIPGQGTLVTSNLYNGSNGYDMASISASVLTHSQGGFSGPSYNYNLPNTNSTVVSSYPGYMLFVRGDRSYTPANGPSTSPTVLRTKGTLTQGNQGAFISSSGVGRTLVANPYASPIDMEPIFAGTVNLAQDMYVWDPALTGNFGVGGFRIVERTGAESYQQTPIVLGGPATPDAMARYIHSGQAFFLRTTGTVGLTDATVNFTEATKSSDVSTVNPIIGGTNDQQMIVNLMIVNPGNIESLADGFRVRYDAAYSAELIDDIQKMGNFGENISSYRLSKKLIVEKRPMIVSKDTIFIRMTNTSVKDYRFQIGTLDFVQSSATAWLQDTWLNTVTGLNLTGAVNNIDFSVTSDPASANQDRFRIIFALNGPLPVTFTSVKAWQQNKDIAVEWKVSNQVNIQKYEVEKSTDGANFSKVSTQVAIGSNGGNATYNWLDMNPVVGNNFYRIRSIGIGADIKISEMVLVKIVKGNPAITVYPNPVVNQIVHIKFTDMEKGDYQIRLINANGQLLLVKKITHTGTNLIQPIELGNMPGGYYQLEITKPDNSKTVKAITVIN